eukprot:scaffold4510_cov183-Amphora_coffeaeformis.AAC.44
MGINNLLVTSWCTCSNECRVRWFRRSFPSQLGGVVTCTPYSKPKVYKGHVRNDLGPGVGPTFSSSSEWGQ